MRFALMIVLCLVGCSETPPKPADPADAKKHLAFALEAWKKGENANDLRKGTPSIHFGDEDWIMGGKLTGFTIEEKADPLGHALRCRAVLEITTAAGKNTKKNVVYQIVTDPAISITRQDN